MKNLMLLGVAVVLGGCNAKVEESPISEMRFAQFAETNKISEQKQEALKRYLRTYARGKEIAGKISDPVARERALADWDRQAQRAALTLGKETAELLSEAGGPISAETGDAQ